MYELFEPISLNQSDLMDSLLATELKPESARALLKALADPLRLRIIETLAEGERCVCDLTSALNLSQSRLSFHLRVLRDAGLLMDRQSGRPGLIKIC